jgi:hypothetical protein
VSSAVRAKFLPEILANLAPWTTAAIRLQSFLDNATMPIGNRNAFGTCSDVIPQALDILELLVDREILETGWRDLKRFAGHLVEV